MIIRKATESDIPEIIDLLKLSLGESLIPKSESLWRWKHLENPFGPSPCLLAEENGKLIGVRAFLRWDYVENQKIYPAYRAVDTATHPDHQGKGIFKKLTMELVSTIQQEGAGLIFNTPNANSSPGYLKMGWEKWGSLPLKLNFHFGKAGKTPEASADWDYAEPLIRKLETAEHPQPGLTTRLLPGYLNWRYRDSPLFPYHYLSDGEKYLLIYRIKEGKMGREFRICDFFTTAEFSPFQKKDLQNALQQRISDSGARFSSFSGLCYPLQKNLDMGIFPILKIGPTITLRKLQGNFQPISQNWAWSLGDLEVF